MMGAAAARAAGADTSFGAGQWWRLVTALFVQYGKVCAAGCSVPGSRHHGTPGGRGHRWPLASTTGRHGGANLGGVKDLTAYRKEASDEQPRRWGSGPRTIPGDGAVLPVGPAVGPPRAQAPPGPDRR